VNTGAPVPELAKPTSVPRTCAASSKGGDGVLPPWCDRPVVGCILALLALISPRLVLVLLWLFGDVLSRAFDSWVVPLLGFFLLPWTTLAYAAFWDWGPGHHVYGFEWFFVGLAFVMDVSSYAGGRAARR
jgi:hypothetical protein